MSEERTAWGWGLASVDAAGTTLDVWYPELNLGEAPAESDRPNHNFGTLAHDEADARGIRRVPVFVVSQLDEPISNAADAYALPYRVFGLLPFLRFFPYRRHHTGTDGPCFLLGLHS